MEANSLILILISIILLILLYRYVKKDVTTITSVESAQKEQVVSLTADETNNPTTNYSISIWFYIENWNYKYGNQKIVYGRMKSLEDIKTKKFLNYPFPLVELGAVQNNLDIKFTVGSEENKEIQVCTIPNVALQKWVNLIISVYGRTLDVYLDGKLVRTNLLSQVPNILDSSLPFIITPNGGFSGWTSRFQYMPNSLNPDQAWNIYTKGYNGKMLNVIVGNTFDSYSIDVTVKQGNKEISNISI